MLIEEVVPCRKPTSERFKDLTGSIFGSWLVIDYVGKRGKVPYWICLCNGCGSKKLISGWNLTRGSTRRCSDCYGNNRLRDFTGQRFARLVVTGFHKNDGTPYIYWWCKCDCGKEVSIMQQSLLQGNTRSCGCLHRDVFVKDLMFQRFGRLQVIKLDRIDGQCFWLCQCDCGNRKVVQSGHLVEGSVRSCGCISRTQNGLSGTKAYRSYYAKRRLDLEKLHDSQWTLQMELAIREYQPCCVVCGSTRKLAVDHVYPLSLGYGLKVGNAVILCVVCNGHKAGKMPDELNMDMMAKILQAAEDFADHWNTLQVIDSLEQLTSS